MAQRIYGNEVNERHRHRYEVNNHYVPALEKTGLIISARTPSEDLPEMMELPQTNTHGSSVCSSTRNSLPHRVMDILCSRLTSKLLWRIRKLYEAMQL